MKTIFAILLVTVAMGAYAEETETECPFMHESNERVVKAVDGEEPVSASDVGVISL